MGNGGISPPRKVLLVPNACHAMALFFVLWHCALCCSILLCAMALCFVLQNFASCHGILLHAVDIVLCAAALAAALRIK